MKDSWFNVKTASVQVYLSYILVIFMFTVVDKIKFQCIGVKSVFGSMMVGNLTDDCIYM